MSRVEEETRKYICQLCGKDFRSTGCLDRHLAKEHETQDQPASFVTCDQCGKGYGDKSRLKMHIKRSHGGYKYQKDFLCVECGKILTSNSNLKQHIHRFHSNNKKTICQECGREFRHPFDLVRHIGQVHTAKERTEQCPQCDKRFYSAASLKSHIRSIHEKLKPWYCEVCPFRCSRLANLNDHRKKSHNQTHISKQTLMDMVEQEQHPFYNKDDLPMIKAATN